MSQKLYPVLSTVSLTLPAVSAVGDSPLLSPILATAPQLGYGQVSQGPQKPCRSARGFCCPVMHGQTAHDLASPDAYLPPGAIHKGPKLKTWIQE